MTKQRMLTWDEFKNMSGQAIAEYHDFEYSFDLSEAIGKAVNKDRSSWYYDDYVIWYTIEDTPLMKALA